MNKNVFFIVIAIMVVVLGGYWLISQSSPQATAPASEQADSITEEDSDEVILEEETKVDEVMEEADAAMEEDQAMEDDGAAMEGDEATANEVKEFTVSGKNFEHSLKEIRVKQGDTVRINFSSTSGFHDWTVDEFAAQTQQVQTGGSSSVEFVADQAGTFEFYCSVGQHRQFGMVGKLIVE